MESVVYHAALSCDMFNHFVGTPCVVSDNQTDGRTAGHCIYRANIASCCKNFNRHTVPNSTRPVSRDVVYLLATGP